MLRRIIIAILIVVSYSCQKKKTDQPILTVIPECKGAPKYLSQAQFVPGRPFGFSVSEKGVTGLALVQFPSQGVPYKQFVLPSWSNAGHLGAVITDKEGNSYVIPRPFINTLKNDPLMQNQVYKIDTHTGEMLPYIKLDGPEKKEETTNPFGLLGIFLDCESEIIYTASVLGSSADFERGIIYAIKMGAQPEVVATMSGVDAMGLHVCYFYGEKYLLFGKARTSEVYKVLLDEKGGFKGEPELLLSLESLGDRGDDKPRKIRFSNKGELMVSGVNFNFNLANTPDIHENIYSFSYDTATEKWVFIGVRKGIM